jgi:hypothetical protein
VKTSLVGTILILLVGAIFATPLSFDFKLLLVNIVLVMLVLLSRYNLRKSKQAKVKPTGNSEHHFAIVGLIRGIDPTSGSS